MTTPHPDCVQVIVCDNLRPAFDYWLTTLRDRHGHTYALAALPDDLQNPDDLRTYAIVPIDHDDGDGGQP